jgi:hypothetical protein
MRVRVVVTPGQALGVTAIDAHGLIHTATTATNCVGSPDQLMCTYRITFGPFKGPKLSIRYTITTSLQPPPTSDPASSLSSRLPWLGE